MNTILFARSALKLLVIFSAGVLIFAFLFLIWRQRKGDGLEENALDEFSKCLTNNGAVMYGAYWCPHCQNEKAQFGESFKYVNYIECTKETQKCLDAKIERYPTWIFRDGRRLAGEQGLDKLSLESGCILQ